MSQLPIHELAPTTARSAKLLAKIYGYEGPEAFSETIPQNAVAIDVGAGNSPFGSTIASLRPDIRWFNVDMRYSPLYPTERARARGPANLQFISADVLELGTDSESPLQPESADLVVSNALLPHLAMTDEQVALTALYNMGGLLNSEGKMLLGKKFINFSFWPRKNGVVRISAAEFAEDPSGISANALSEVRLSPFSEKGQYVASHLASAIVAGKLLLTDLQA